jgi:hypothetical protein
MASSSADVVSDLIDTTCSPEVIVAVINSYGMSRL